MSALPAPSDRPDYGSRVRELEQAFAAFNATSALLQNAYRELEQRATLLSAELAEARSERLLQLAEKERIADRLQRLLETLPGGVVVLADEAAPVENDDAARQCLEQTLQPVREALLFRELRETLAARLGELAGEHVDALLQLVIGLLEEGRALVEGGEGLLELAQP